MPAAFDEIIIVDWSAQSTRKVGPDSIWIHESSGRTTNAATRHDAAALLRSRLLELRGGRVLVGVDFGLAYPVGFAEAAGLDPALPPWEAVWAHLGAVVVDDERNANNRWQVAADLNARLGAHQFWGAPPSRAGEHLPRRKPLDPPLPALRPCETVLRSAGGQPPKSMWQLLGAGSVGSQSLLGIAMLQRLRTDPTLRDRVRVWPFETGFTTDPTGGADDAIVFAEVWPSMLHLDPADHPVKDAQQVIGLTRLFRTLDAAGEFGQCFTPHLPGGLPGEVANEAVHHSGWVLTPFT